MNSIWKRSLSLLLAMVMVLSAVPMGALAEEVVEEEVVCDHANYEETDYCSPSCTEAGYAEYTCLDCGETWTEEEGAFGHDYADGFCTSCGAENPDGWTEEDFEGTEDYSISTQDAVNSDNVLDFDKVPEKATVGLVLLDADATTVLTAYLTKPGNLKTLVLDAIDYAGDRNKATVKFGGNDISNIMGLYSVYTDFVNALEKHKTLKFELKDGEGAKDIYIICRNVGGIQIVFPELTIANPGEPDGLATTVAGMLNDAKIKVYHNNDDLTEWATKKTSYSVSKKNGTAFVWPQVGETTTVSDAITVTIQDDLGNKTVTRSGALTLKDTTPIYTVTYMSNGAKVAEQRIPAGGTTTKPEEPVRTYYNFIGWATKANAEKADWNATVNAAVTYYAVWEPDVDKNGDHIADQEQKFPVVFDYNYPESLEKDEPEAVTKYIPWGTVINNAEEKPADPKLPGYTFAGWQGGHVKAGGSKDPVTVTAQWVQNSEDTYQVVYHLTESVTVTLPTQGGYAINPYEDYEKDDYVEDLTDSVIWDAWYTKPYGTEDADEFDFSKKISDLGLSEGEKLHLYAHWWDDNNNNGMIDGTAEDPSYVYHFYTYEEGKGNDAPVVTKTPEPEDLPYDPNKSMGAINTDGEDYVFDRWNVVENNGNTQYNQIWHCYPVYVADKNYNNVADKSEMIPLDLDVDDTVKDKFTITVDGIAPEDGDTCILRNSKEASELKVVLTDDTVVVSKIALVPVVATTGLYDEDTVDGEKNLSMTYDGRTITATIPADTKDETISGKYNLRICIRDARTLTLKETQDTLNQSNANKETVYNALVSAPAYDATAVTIEYKAREAVTGGKVSAQKLYDAVKPYESVVPGAWDLLQGWLDLKEESGEWYYYYNLDEKWMNIEADVSNVVRTPQEIVDTYITQVAATVDATKPNALISQLGAMKQELEKQLATANIHPFGYNPTGANEVEEVVNITYQQDPWTLKAENVSVKLTDSRANNSLKVSDQNLSFAYKQFTMDKIRDELELEKGLKSDIQFNVDLSDKGVGTYQVVATYPGNDEYKQCTVSFNVTITKAQVSITMKKLDVAQERFSFENVQASAGDAAVLQVIAGWDVTSGELNLAAPVVSGLKGKAWVVAPEDMQELVELALEKLGYGTKESINLSQFTRLVENHRDVLETRLSATNVSRLISFLNKVSTYVDAEMDIVFGKPENVNTGIYLNLAVLADPNYEGSVDMVNPEVNGNTEFAYGGIVVSPVIAVPNLGGVQLVNGNDAGNIFSFGSGEKVNLGVQVNSEAVSDATIYYYGITGSAAVYNDIKAPTASGLYVAATVYYSADGSKIGSDSAIVIVGRYEADMTIYNTVVAKEDGESYAPTYDVVNKDGSTPGYPDIVMISGPIAEENAEEKLDLKLLKEVNMDVPQWLADMWKAYVKSGVGNSQGLTNADINNLHLSKDTLNGFLDWCIRSVDTAAKKLESLGVNNAITGKVNTVTDWTTNTLKKVQEKVDGLGSGVSNIHIHVYQKVDGKATITKYSDVGTYYYVGIVADSDYLPTVAAGGLVITEDEDALVLWDTEVPFDGKGHKPITADEDAMATAMTVIREEDGKLTILLDETLMNDLGLKAGNTLTLNDLIDDKGGVAQSKVDNIINKMAEAAKKKLPERFGDNVDGGAEKLKNLSKNLKDKMVNKLKSVAGNDGNKQFALVSYNANNLPSAIGTYQFYTFTYGMSYATAKLTIHPWYVDITANNAKKLYGEGNPDFTATLEFYSYQTSRKNGGVVTDRIVDKDKDSAGLKYTISRTSTDENVGTYTGDLKVTVTEKGNFQVGTLVDGDFTIEAKEITVKPDKDFEKYYGDADPEMTASVTLDNGTKITINMKHNGVNVLEDGKGYPLYQDGKPTFELAAGDIAENYDVKFDADGKTMTIKPALITVNIKDQELNVDKKVGDLATILSNRSDLDKLPYEKATEGNKGDVDLSQITIELAVENLSLADVNKTLTHGEYVIYCKSHTKSDNYTITFNPGKLTVGLHTEDGDNICWNVDTGVYYTSVYTALSKAESGQTVQMLADATEANGKNEIFLNVSEGVTFDLNGYYVQAEGAASFGGVIMDSEPMATTKNAFESTFDDNGLVSGGILVASDKVVWTSTNSSNASYLPIYDTVTGSYKFFKGSVSDITTKDGNNNVRIRFKLLLDSMEAYGVLAGTTNSCIDLSLSLSWKNIAAFKNVSYSLKSETVKSYADYVHTNQVNDISLYLSVNGLDRLGSGNYITAQAEFEADLHVTYKSSIYSYIIP